MNICMVTADYPPKPGGISSYAKNLAHNLAAKGHDVIILTRGEAFRWAIQVDSFGFPVVKVPFVKAYPLHVHLHCLGVKAFLKQLLRREEIDVLHIHSPICTPLNMDLPTVVTVHTPLLEDSRHIEQLDANSLLIKLFSRFFHPFERSLMLNADVLTTLTQSIACQLVEYGVDPRSVHIIGSGVDLSLFKPRRDYLSVHKPIVLYTGRVTYRKGLYDLIECARYVVREIPDAQFLITGTGPLQYALKRRVEALGLSKNVQFKGHVTFRELLKLYSQATVFVLPSYQEGLPISLLEAMASGLPVVVTRIPPLLEVVTHLYNGLTVPVKSPKKLAESLLLLLRDADLRRMLGKNARSTVERHYTWSKVVERLESCYKLAMEVHGQKKSLRLVLLGS